MAPHTTAPRPPSDKRRHVRSPAAEGVLVRIEGDRSVAGRLADISTDGLMLFVSAPIPSGSDAHLVIEDSAQTGELRVTARCRWSDEVPERGRYRVGWEFSPPGQVPAARIRRLILNLAEP
ncbi:MAG: PilZ domain-containing protein [Spirochaetes bacterium]|nr:PilZ domain-containing protein [Spirochaetota bacterium]